MSPQTSAADSLTIFFLVSSLIAGIVVAIVFIIKRIKRKEIKAKEDKRLLRYSDKVKNYHGKNMRKAPGFSDRWYDNEGRMKFVCDDSEKIFEGDKCYLDYIDKKYVREFVELIFDNPDFNELFYMDKVERILNAKEKNNQTLIDIRHFFKNHKYLLVPFHITPDIRSKIIHYYCDTRAIKCIQMPKTKYTPKSTRNYLAYFPLDSFDDMSFIAFLLQKYPMQLGQAIHGFESGFTQKDLSKYPHNKDFVFEYIYRMMFDERCKFFSMENAFVETHARILKAPGYPDTSEYSSKLAEIKAEMQKEGLIKSNFHNENERKLFFLVKEKYPDAIYQYKEEWLDKLSLDIYIPSIKVAIEYQGGQHYKSVRFYGGKENLEKIQSRDALKKELCSKHNVELIEWKYDVPINEKNLQSLINGLNK